jgi:hypothetical protein
VRYRRSKRGIKTPQTDIDLIKRRLRDAEIGHCKNPTSHRDVVIERVTAARLIALASHLLSQIEPES